MKLTFKFSLIICVLSTSLFSGCNTGMFKKPDLGRLAFWKNENLRLAAKKDDIPPPSLHFAPDPGEGSATKNELKDNIEQIIADARKSKDTTLANNEKPIRKPYTLDTIDPQIGDQKKKESNDFAVSKQINKFQNASNRAFEATDNAIKSAGTAVENTANTLSGWKNDLQNSAQNQIKTVSNEFKNQAGTAIEKTNKSVHDFVNSAESSINNTVSNVTNSLDNSFKSANTIANPFVNGSSTKSGLTPMTASQNSSNEFVSKYKQASQQFAGNNAPQTDKIKQSSFNADVKKSSSVSTPLKPAQPKNGITNYPSTSFGKFKPLTPDKSKSEDSFEIPPQLLRGNGSFSPGSTKPLRPVTSDQ